MRPATFLMLIFAVGIAFLLLSAAAMAQGCGLQPASGTVDCCGNPNHPDQGCIGGGDPNNFCFLSFGNCCGVEYSLANSRPDTKCSPIGQNFGGGASYRPGVLPPGSCAEHRVAAQEMLATLERLASRGEFVIRERLNFEVGQ